MLKNFFKIAFRNLWRSKGFSFINISGLAIGMASAILILLWIQNEVSYDQFHEKKDRIYEAWNRASFSGTLNAGIQHLRCLPEPWNAICLKWNRL